MKTAYIASTVFTGNDTLHNHAVIINNGIIEDILPAVSISGDINVINLGDVIVAPPFIDLQLYGAHGRLLAVHPDEFTVAEIYRYCLSGGAAYCMPTVATHPYEIIFKCVDAIKNYWQQGGKGVLGLHVEGPWISKAKRGAHKEDWIFSPSVDEAKELLEYGKDVIKIITLAPEECSKEIIHLIQSYNIIISAGHSNATYEQATKSFNEGIKMVTHLYNAMSPLLHRAPGLVGAVLDNEMIRASIIPDGYHVDYAAIRIAKKMLGERLFAITDSVTETNEGFYQHHLEGDKYTANGILSGSALTMNKAVQNLIKHVGVSWQEALRMCSFYPARVANKSDEIALLKKGYPAEMAVLDKELNVLEMIV
ncbi:MAG: N-acetylglucosamine-6-phosphate deacetylase [Chitinophagaceae bacterium]